MEFAVGERHADAVAGRENHDRDLANWKVGRSWQAIICAASVCCCVPMAIPQAHLVAFCGDIGIGAATGATMLSVLLGCAFISRQFWGAFADRHGGLKTVLAGSAFQAVSIRAFVLTQNEAGLFVVAVAYGLGFSRASFPPTWWRSATCSRQPRRPGASHWCCSPR